MKKLAVIFLVLAPILVGQAGLNLETRRYCCGLGANYANSGLQCDSFQTPIAAVQKEDEASCIHSIEVCCKKQNEELQCNKGIEEAKSGGCSTISEAGPKKDCCEACTLGNEAKQSGQACQDNLGLGPPLDKAFVDCCNNPETSTTSTTSTTESPSPISEALKAISSTDSSYSPLPPLENICDIGDVCAQICIPTGDSYRCDCNKGFTLMSDRVSCKPDKRAAKKGDRCAVNNPCDHECTDTGLAIKCSCKDGFELAKDKRTCQDIDECALGVHECEPNEECVNDEGGYFCDDPNFEGDPAGTNTDDLDNKCPSGYKFNYDNMVCDDIDECQFNIICPRPQTCINTIGSFKCEGEDRPQCPPGFHFKAATETCADIDECITGNNDCNKESQVCLNTVGNYTCIDKASKKTCPPGFKKNPYTQNCDDIDECVESDSICGSNEKCVNEPGGHKCVPINGQPYPPYEPSLPPRPVDGDVSSVSSSTSSEAPTTTSPKTIPTSARPASCQRGYKYSKKTNSCNDIDECEEDDQACDSAQDCYNTPGSYVCNCKSGFTKDYQTGACIDVNECQIGTHECTVAQRCDNTIGSYLCARTTGCGTGYTLNYANGLCEDDDECALGTHQCNTLGPNFKCRNTLGSYRCDSVRLTTKPHPTPAPRPQPPTQIYSELPPLIYPPVRQPYPTPIRPQYPASNYGEPTRPQFSSPKYAEPTRPQYPPPDQEAPPRPQYSPPDQEAPPRPQYPSPNYEEPVRSPYPSYPTYPTRNYPAEPPRSRFPVLSDTFKKCLPGYRMSSQGVCEDINECESNPCERGQKCLNFNGRYECISAIQCKIGYELDESGETCVDVNECTRGTHKCSPTQICKNGQGYYICECPPGHHLNKLTQLCEDIDECKYYRACSMNSDCLNTIGSYRCRCKDGFREVNNICEDIDECKETSRLCEHNCVNIWGSYRCACNPGFTLNFDNRTCTDVDECERFKDKKICIGPCENIPGSYRCTCPKGYRLGTDSRTCTDIDECILHKPCPRPDDICLNTRGGHKCFAITCPHNYFRDPHHKGRCKRPANLCDPRDNQCIKLPEQFTYHYITLVSNLPISDVYIQFFQINGPTPPARAEFAMSVVDVRCPHGIERVNERFFQMVKLPGNIMQLFLVRSIKGPQEIELKVEMHLYQGNIMMSNVVSHIFIVVSSYSF